jgi:hypothetical protein
MTNKYSEKVDFSSEREKLDLIISFLENLLNSKDKTIKDKKGKKIPINVDKIEIKRLLEKLYTLNLILSISDLTKNEDLISLINNELTFNFPCLERKNIKEATRIFDCIPENENTIVYLLSIKAERFNKNELLSLKFGKKNLSFNIETFIHPQISSVNHNKELDLLDFIFKKALSVLFYDKNIYSSLEDYINSISERLQHLDNLKRQIEEFLAKDVLKKVSEEYKHKSEEKILKIPKWFIFFTFSLILILCPLFFTPKLLDDKPLHDILIKASIGFIPIVVGFYLLRYSLKLRDLQEEYKFKSIMLSSLPALSILIDDKNERDKIITTILLEASNLQTLTKDKGEIAKEILPVVELANKLRNN